MATRVGVGESIPVALEGASQARLPKRTGEDAARTAARGRTRARRSCGPTAGANRGRALRASLPPWEAPPAGVARPARRGGDMTEASLGRGWP